MEPLVCIILVNYNRLNDTFECVKSLIEIEYTNFRIILVDNHSGDMAAMLKDPFLSEHCELIQASVNGGFSYGNNLGIKYAQKYAPQYFLLLNNDTIVKKDFLIKMVRLAEERKSSCGLVTGRSCYYNQPEKINFRGGLYDRRRCFPKYIDPSIEPEYGKEITFATGCLWLLPARTIEQVGLLNERYFMYAEDVEYCCRIIDKGLKIYYRDDAIIYHKISASSGQNSWFTQYYIIRNDLFNLQRFGTSKSYAYFLHIERYIKDLIKRRKHIKPVIWAWRDFLLGRYGEQLIPKK